MTVPPKVFLMSLTSSSAHEHTAKRRSGPIGTFSGVRGAGLSVSQTTSPTPARASPARRAAAVGVRAAPSAWPPSVIAARATPAAASAKRPSVPGLGAGRQGTGGGCGAGAPSRSKTTVARSTPAMPSISA